METPLGSPQPAPEVRRQPENWTSGQERIAVGALAIVALALRLSAIPFHQMVAWDGAHYINYFRDPSWRWIFPPGYPIVIEAFRFLFSDPVLAAQFASALFGGLLAVPLFLLARHFASSKAAFVATAVAVLNPLMIRYGALTMSEAQYVFFAVAAFCCYVRRSPALFGAASGAAYLTRPEALLFVAILLGYDAVKERSGRFLAIALGALLLFAAPYLIALRAETGRWSLSPKSENLRAWDSDWRVNVTREGSPENGTGTDLWQGSVASYPGRIAAHGENLLVNAGIPLLLLAAAGMAMQRNILLAGLAMFFVLPLFGLTPYARFMLPFVPFLAIFAALALERIAQQHALYIGGLVCLLGVAPVFWEVYVQDDDMIELKTAGLAIKPETRPGDLFLDRKPYTAFYAGGRYTQIPNEPPDTVLAFARRAGARFLVLGERAVYVFRPQLKPLLYGSDSSARARGLKSAYTSALQTGNGVRILEIVK